MKTILKKIKSEILILFCICLYTLYITLKITKNQALLADDLGMMYKIQHIDSNLAEFLWSFLDSTTMSARPISGIVTGMIIYVSKFEQNFYFLALLFFPISILMLFKVALSFLDKTVAFLLVLLYTSSIFSSSIQFSPIMLNSNLALIFWLLSIYFLKINYKPILSSVFFLFSVLSYEIFLPLILLNVLLHKKIKYSFYYFVGTVIIVLIYRKIIQPSIFENSYQRDNVSQLLNFSHLKKIFIFSIKMFLKDYILAFTKAIYNIRYQNLTDLIIPLIIGISFYISITKEKLQNIKQNPYYILIASTILILLSLTIFAFSTYYPTIFGFNNRNLGATRIFFSLLLISILLILIKTLKINHITSKLILTLLIILSFYTNLSVADSWIYASNFNNKIFLKLKKELNYKNNLPSNICIDYNIFHFQKSNKYLILREPTFYENWEAPYLAFKNGIKIENKNIYNIERAKGNCDYTLKYIEN